MAINVDISKITGINQVGNSYQRKSAVPLDYYSLFNTKAEAEAYAASNPVSYVGQVISYIDNGEVKVCVIANAAGLLKEVGKAPLAAADGAVEVAADGSIKVLVDDSTIKIIDNKLTASLPEMDNKSIESIEGKISMHDFGIAYYEYVPEVKDEQGNVTKEASYTKVAVSESKPWKAGLEPKVVTEEGKLVIGWFEPNPTTIEGVNDQVTAVQGTVADLEQSVGVPSAEGQEATGLYKEVEDVQADVEELVDTVGTSEDALDENVNTLWANVNDQKGRIEALEGKEDKDTKYTAKEGDKVLSLNGTEFATQIGLKHENGRISLTGIDGAEIAGFSDADFIEDGFLQKVDLVDENPNLEGEDKTIGGPFLKFTWNTSSSLVPNETYVAIGELIDVYTAGNGLELSANEFAIKLDSTGEAFLSVGANGLKLSGIQDAIDAAQSAAEATAAADATAKANAAQTAAEATASADATSKADAAREAAIKAAAEDATSKADAAKQAAIDDAAGKYATKTYVGEFTTGDDAYKDLGSVVAYINKKAEETLAAAQGGSSETAASVALALQNYKNENDPKVKANTDKLATIAEGAQVNVIESVVVSNGEAEATQPHKLTATLSGKTVTLNDTALQTAIADAKKAGTDAAQIASEAVATAGENANKIQANTTDISNLKTLTGEHTTKIANLESADTEHHALYESLKNTVDGHTSAIAGKAAQSSLDAVSQKTSANEQAIKTLNETTVPAINQEVAKKANASEVAATYATKAEVGTPATGKTIVQMIAEAQSAATYDDSEIRGLVSDNATAIENITKEGGAIAVAVKAEVDRAVEAEQALADDIAEINALLNTVSSEDNITSLKELAIWVEEHGSEASKMAESIKANADAIELINDAEKGILVQAKAHSDANLAEAKKYADAVEAKIPGVDDKTIKLAENKAYVAEVSTDILVQGAQELVLCGGNASGFGSNS